MTDLEQKAREIATSPGILIDCFPTDPSAIDQDLLAGMIAAALREARNQALEEAAGLAGPQDREAWSFDEMQAANRIAARIRALKDTTP